MHTYRFRMRYITSLYLYSRQCKHTKRLHHLDYPSVENRKRALCRRMMSADKAPTFCQAVLSPKREIGQKKILTSGFDPGSPARRRCCRRPGFPPNSNRSLGHIVAWWLKKGEKESASPGNRTRVARMGILHDTTTPATPGYGLPNIFAGDGSLSCRAADVGPASSVGRAWDS